MEYLDEMHAKGMLRAAAQAIVENKPLLTEVDSAIGDGDHGIGMAKGMKAALAALDGTEDDGNVYRVFHVFGKAMLMSMGGASGVIFSSMFLGAAPGQGPEPALDAQAFAAMMGRGLEAVKERGKARVGDKTMVDALEPAVEAMRATAGGGYAQMLEAAAAAAWEGVEATKGQQARFGRAKSLMERAVGHQDAGATSVAIMIGAMGEYARLH